MRAEGPIPEPGVGSPLVDRTSEPVASPRIEGISMARFGSIGVRIASMVGSRCGSAAVRSASRRQAQGAGPGVGDRAAGGPGRARGDHGPEHGRLRRRLAAGGDRAGQPGPGAGYDRRSPRRSTGTITLLTALPDLSTDIIVSGPGASALAVARSAAAGTPEFRIFTVTAGAEVTISGLTITGGRADRRRRRHLQRGHADGHRLHPQRQLGRAGISAGSAAASSTRAR